MIAPYLKKTILFFLLLMAGWKNIYPRHKEQVLQQLNKLLVHTVMDDLFTPPVASRIYVYPNIAFYECIRFDDPSFLSLSGKLNGLVALPGPQKNIDNFISASIAFSFVAQNLVASEYKFEEWRKAFTDSIRSVSDTSILNSSFQYGKKIADSIIRWIQKDNYMVRSEEHTSELQSLAYLVCRLLLEKKKKKKKKQNKKKNKKDTNNIK